MLTSTFYGECGSSALPVFFYLGIVCDTINGMHSSIHRLDERIIHFLRKISWPLSRFSLFIIYVWFGALKVFATSPANPLVAALLAKTLPFLTFNQFIVGLGVYEMIIGICFLIPGLERAAVLLLIPHMITTFMPLILLPEVTWHGFMEPTLEGQYIVKNLLIISLAFVMAARLHPRHPAHPISKD